jgi:hypothetical protein
MKKETPKLHQYLIEKGLLHTNDKVLKVTAIKQYWKAYYRTWQKEKRAAQHSYRIFVSDKEKTIIIQAAKELEQSPTVLIKQAALAYVTRLPIELHTKSYNEIKSMLYQPMNAVNNALDEERITDEYGQLVLQKLDVIHKEILHISQKMFAV